MGDGSWTGWEVLDAASIGVGAAGTGVKAAFSGGTNSVFWSGYSQGGREAAEALGVTLEKTAGGRTLDWLAHGVGIKVPDSVWNFAASTFSHWTTIEKPILQQRGIPIRYVQ